MKCEPPGRQTIIYITETFESFSERSTYHIYICLIVLPALPKSGMHTIYDLVFTKGITILQEETSNKYQEEIISFNIKSFPLNLVQFTKAEMFYQIEKFILEYFIKIFYNDPSFASDIEKIYSYFTLFH